MSINPLQALNSTLFGNQINPVLESVEDAEATCNQLYQKLTTRTEQLAETTLRVEFSWRVQVGGMRGFRELLLPVFHPVYGIPYIPSSSLKGVARAWARNNGVDKKEINFLLGELDQGVGAVQILDAFPTNPCLSLDMANPQWGWEGDRVKYNPTPHAFLSMEKPKILIGFIYTGRGKKQSSDDGLNKVKEWLENGLKTGIGSRVSAGYGRIALKSGLPHSSKHHFYFYSQGVYGANPPSNQNNWQGDIEFRPIALRGILRYWFRAIALGLYDVNTTKRLENELFGQLSTEGSLRIAVSLTEEDKGNRDNPYYCQGSILLEAKRENHLKLAESVLQLASHLGGFGRSSRRPLHLNNNRLRGCFWELSEFILPCQESDWQIFIKNVLDSFRNVQPEGNAINHNLGDRNNRYQDILNQNTNIFLIPCPQLKYPNEVNNWRNEGYKNPVIGEGLRILYSSDRFKGVNQQRRGNENVGGKLGIPSFVWIKSNYVEDEEYYQAVTIFGVNHRDRANFANAIPPNAIKVW